MPVLRLTRDGVEIRSVDLGELGKSDVLIGRSDDADVRIDDRAVGRSHAMLKLGAKGVAIQKLSKFGKLTLNGKDIGEALIREGDIVHLADYTVHIVSDVMQASHPAEIAPSPIGSSLETPTVTGADSAVQIPTQSSLPSFEIKSDASPAAAPDVLVETKLLEIPAAATENTARSNPILEGDASLETGSLSHNSDFGENKIEMSADVQSNNEVAVDDRTAVIAPGKVHAELLFKPGEANGESIEIKRDEISIGRGSNCDVILADKKASRKHAAIKRVAAAFVVRDLGSANGTYVNGELIAERELQGGDLLRIGDTEFIFKATSREYEEKKDDLLSVPSIEQVPSAPGLESTQNHILQPSHQPGSVLQGADALAAQAELMNKVQDAPTATPLPAPKESLLAKFRRQNPVRRAIIMIVLAMLFYLYLEEDKKTQKRGPASKVSSEADNAAFNALPAEKKQFVVNTYQFAFDLYTQEKYEESLYEIRKVLQILPNGYKQSKDIESYALKAIEQISEKAEARRKKEAEEKVREEVAALVAQAEEFVDKGMYADARNIFAQILERDPENPTVQRLKQAIDQKEEQARLEEEAKRERLARKETLQALLDEGNALLKKKKYYEAIAKMEDVPVAGYQDEAMLNEAERIVSEAKRRLIEDVKPHLDAASQAMLDGDLAKARDQYLKALEVDYKNAVAKTAIDGIRKTLYERAKRIYTEALIAEGISNFREARAKFKQCLEIAMPDDIYHGRCTRKFKRFELLDRNIANEPSGVSEESFDE